MFVPSLSWQDDRLKYKTARKGAFFAPPLLARHPPQLTLPLLRCSQHSYPLRENGLFSSFPYVCPEPVLAKISRLYTNGSKRPFSHTALIRAVFAAKAKVALDREQAAAAHRQNDEPTRGGADGALCKATHLPFLSAFPVFVPSLSW